MARDDRAGDLSGNDTSGKRLLAATLSGGG